MKKLQKPAKKILTAILALSLAAAMFPAASYAASAQDEAVAYLAERGIYQGDENGNLNLDKSLTRAELAVILTRLSFVKEEWELWGMAKHSDPEHRYNPFTDVPAWALPYVEYCYVGSLVKGVTPTLFDPAGTVNPKMVCTVMLRWLRYAETDWNYGTSLEKAREIGLTDSANVSGETISRSDTALVIRKGMEQKEHKANGAGTTPTPTQTPTPTETPNTDTMTIDEMKAEIVRLVNIERVNAGLPEFEVSDDLMTSAQIKADDMIENNYFSHTSPVHGTPSDLIKKHTGVVGAETLALRPETPSEVFIGWMNSSSHKAIILSTKYTHIGIGITQDPLQGYCWVQHFAVIPTPK
jgi:uncharacterized protein YkwD